MGADKTEGEKRARWTEGIRLIWSTNGTRAALSRRAFAPPLCETATMGAAYRAGSLKLLCFCLASIAFFVIQVVSSAKQVRHLNRSRCASTDYGTGGRWFEPTQLY